MLELNIKAKPKQAVISPAPKTMAYPEAQQVAPDMSPGLKWPMEIYTDNQMPDFYDTYVRTNYLYLDGPLFSRISQWTESHEIVNQKTSEQVVTFAMLIWCAENHHD